MEVFINMEFFVRKNSTLPVVEVSFIKDGRSDYNYYDTLLTSNTIYFSMIDVETGVYKVVNGLATYSEITKSITYQLTKKNTNKVGRYEIEITINNGSENIKLPLPQKLFLNITNSFSEADQCCKGKEPPLETFRIKTQSNILIQTQNSDYINYQY
jgi:hypothetical protein